MNIITTIAKRHARIFEVNPRHLDHNYENEIQLFHDAPKSVAVVIRTFGPITGEGYGNGVKRNMLAIASLTPEEAKELRDALDTFIANEKGGE
jgi:hypothetical protein